MLFIALLSLAAFLSIFISTLRLGISPMPTNRIVRNHVLRILPKNFSGTFVDIGSGWGTICCAVAKTFPKATVIGLEKSIVPYLISYVRKSKRCTFLYRDFRDGLPEGDVYYTYLYPGGMKSIEKHTPLRGMLISNAFALPGKKPDTVTTVGTFYKTPVYTYSWILEKSSSLSNREKTF